MVETLYKTKTPEASLSECYELILENKIVNDRHLYFVREIHGWWDDQRKRFIHEQYTLSPEEGEGYATLEKATERYKLQRHTRAKSGFIHSFSPHYFGEPYQYEQIASG